MTAVLMDPIHRPSSLSPRPMHSRFAACLRRFAGAGLRLVVTTPPDSRVFARRGIVAETDLALLREQAGFVSAA